MSMHKLSRAASTSSIYNSKSDASRSHHNSFDKSKKFEAISGRERRDDDDDDLDEEDDLVGFHITRFLNQGRVPYFTCPRTQGENRLEIDAELSSWRSKSYWHSIYIYIVMRIEGLLHAETAGSFFPLISSRNCQRVNRLIFFVVNSLLSIPVYICFWRYVPFKACAGKAWVFLASRIRIRFARFCPRHPLPSLWHSLMGSIHLVLIALTLLAAFSSYSCLLSCTLILKGFVMFFSFLFDFDELLSICPLIIVHNGAHFYNFVKKCDETLYGKEIKGRNWDSEEAERQWRKLERQKSKRDKRNQECLTTSHLSDDDLATAQLTMDIFSLNKEKSANTDVSLSCDTEAHRTAVEFSWHMLKKSIPDAARVKKQLRIKTDLTSRRSFTFGHEKNDSNEDRRAQLCRSNSSPISQIRSHPCSPSPDILSPLSGNKRSLQFFDEIEECWREDDLSETSSYDSNTDQQITDLNAKEFYPPNITTKLVTHTRKHSTCPQYDSIEIVEPLNLLIRGRTSTNIDSKEDQHLFASDVEDAITNTDQKHRKKSQKSGGIKDHRKRNKEEQKPTLQRSDSNASSVSTVETSYSLTGSSNQGHRKLNADVNWVDVGTRIGIRLLNSEQLQKIMKADGAATEIDNMDFVDISQLSSNDIPVPMLNTPMSVISNATRVDIKENFRGDVVALPSNPMWSGLAHGAIRDDIDDVLSVSELDLSMSSSKIVTISPSIISKRCAVASNDPLLDCPDFLSEHLTDKDLILDNIILEGNKLAKSPFRPITETFDSHSPLPPLVSCGPDTPSEGLIDQTFSIEIESPCMSSTHSEDVSARNHNTCHLSEIEVLFPQEKLSQMNNEIPANNPVSSSLMIVGTPPSTKNTMYMKSQLVPSNDDGTQPLSFNSNDCIPKRTEFNKKPSSALYLDLPSIELSLPTKGLIEFEAPTITSLVSPNIISPSVMSFSPNLKRRKVLTPGIKMFCPLFPYSAIRQNRKSHNRKVFQFSQCYRPHQIGTVVSCHRMYLPGFKVPLDNVYRSLHSKLDTLQRQEDGFHKETNCLSIYLRLEQNFLRNGKFVEMHIRIPDEHRYIPRHSKYPIGSCVATTYGLGVIVGWRVEDDMHLIRSLWKKRGNGSALAYLHRNALHSVVEAAVGFLVQTALGKGIVMSYVQADRYFLKGKYFVLIKDHGHHKGHLMEFLGSDILSCSSAKFIPVIEHIKEAASFEIQYATYLAALERRKIEAKARDDNWGGQLQWSEEVEIIFGGLVKAVAENPNFDEELNIVVTIIIEFLERLDIGKQDSLKETLQGLGFLSSRDDGDTSIPPQDSLEIDLGHVLKLDSDGQQDEGKHQSGGWFMDDILGGIFGTQPETLKTNEDSPTVTQDENTDLGSTPIYTEVGSAFLYSQSVALSVNKKKDSYSRAFATLQILTRGMTIARADATSNRPNLQIGLSMVQEFLVFLRTVIKIRQKKVSRKASEVRLRTLKLVKETVVPIQNRMINVAHGISERLQHHGIVAKARLASFFDIIINDDIFMKSLEHGEWNTCLAQFERGLVRAKILDQESCAQYRVSIMVIYNVLSPRATSNQAASNRTSKQIVRFAKILKWMATPHRSILKLLTKDIVLEFFERVLSRVFRNNTEACEMLNMYAASFHSFRHLLMLKNVSVAGKLYMPLLDAADEEFAWAVTRMPENTKEIVEPLSKLFSLGVANFRQLMTNSESAGSWMDFLMETEAIELIQELDMKLVLGVESLCNDIKDTMGILPYYSSIDEDILNLLDEIDLEKFLIEAAEAIVDMDRFQKYLREKSVLAIDKFLNYLPKMSIPLDRREIADGKWLLTCRAKNGSDLALSDVKIERDNLTCQVMGSENVLSPMFGTKPFSKKKYKRKEETNIGEHVNVNAEVSILDDVKVLILNAQRYGSWGEDMGPPCPASLSPTLEGIPLSQVLMCAIGLWQNLEIDDDELLEIAIRDVSHQIQLQKEQEEGLNDAGSSRISDQQTQAYESRINSMNEDSSFDEYDVVNYRRFNPQADPTVLYLEMKGMTFHLNDFLFRVEPKEKRSIFDPIFDGTGSLAIKNVSIRLRLECRKERLMKLDSEITVPVLQLQELDVKLDEMKFKFKDTGLDWLLNKVVKGFSENITEVVELNVKEQIITQVHKALEHINAFIEVNPDLMLGILGITIDDLEENIVWV